MRRTGLKISIAVLTFIVGVTAYLLWSIPKPSPSQALPLTVSLCQLQSNPELYDGKVIHVRAIVYTVEGKPYLHDGNCLSENNAFPLVDLRGFEGLNGDLNAWLRVEGNPAFKGERKEAYVIIVGIFDKNYGQRDEWLRFRIIPMNIEQLSPLRKSRPRGAA